MGMSMQVNDFRWEPGKNDAEYIRLLESSRNEWQKIAQKAITKLKTLSRVQEPRVKMADTVRRAKWVLSDDGEEMWYCSECGYEPTVFEDSLYCAGCGAKMDGGDDDETD